MKVAAVFLITLAGVLGIGAAVAGVRGVYAYEREIESHWSLADKASAIPAKADHMDRFVAALESAGLDGQHDAAIFTTPDNGFDENLAALKTLQARFHEIKTMDPRSFEYQTAIQQITAQEQGEAHKMLSVFDGCWWKEHHPLLWGWWGALYVIALIVVLFVGLVMAGFAWNW